MKANINVTTRAEGDAIRAGLEDPSLRAMVIITGVLNSLPPRSRVRVLDWVKDTAEENSEPVPSQYMPTPSAAPRASHDAAAQTEREPLHTLGAAE